ncbi:plasmodesmata-located protein 6-like [Bidens hawaiensis]|uniref:plasmodesmata-located protein 6-like n=1 Tax=Bidens hawaiensis TaxID=980011 RepID=UPI00404A5A89
MLQAAFSLSFLILSFIFSLFSVSTADSNVYVQCSQLNFTSMTPYESNINSLFTSLTDSASIYNFNKFETSPQSDTVYGLFQCRGDVSSKYCNDCVANSINQLKTTCPMSMGGEIQLEACFVKYDDTSFFGVEDKMEAWRRCGPSIGYNSDVLNRIEGALDYLVRGNGEYFRGGNFGSVQGMAQCVQDLSLSDCQDCLVEASGRLRSECETSSSGDMYLGKCYIRYTADQGKLVVRAGGDLNSDNNYDNDPDKKKNNKEGKGHKKTVLNYLNSVYRYNYKKIENLKIEVKNVKEEAEKKFQSPYRVFESEESVGGQTVGPSLAVGMKAKSVIKEESGEGVDWTFFICNVYYHFVCENARGVKKQSCGGRGPLIATATTSVTGNKLDKTPMVKAARSNKPASENNGRFYTLFIEMIVYI